jgi:hypothetical protein
MITALARPQPRALFAAIAAVVWTAGSFVGVAAPARAATPGYSAALAAPLAEPRREIINGVVWRCEGARCTAADDGSRPLVVCRRVAKTFGAVASFDAPRGAFSAEEVGRCNAS